MNVNEIMLKASTVVMKTFRFTNLYLSKMYAVLCGKSYFIMNGIISDVLSSPQIFSFQIEYRNFISLINIKLENI